ALKELVRDYTPEKVAQICGIRVDDLVQAARWFAGADAALSLWCQGLNQSSAGTAKNAALINLHLATGQIGKPGAGPFSLTGQPNAMGGREVGGMANLLSAHRDLDNPKHRAEVARLWSIGAAPAAPGPTAVARARRLEQRLRPAYPARRPSVCAYTRAEDIFDEHRETTRGRDLDITGLSYALLDARGPQQWPFAEGAQAGKARLYADGVFP